MNGADLDFQQEAYKALRSVVDAAVPVETMPAVDQRVPYVFVGPSTTQEHPIGLELEFEIETWSAAEGTEQAKQLQQSVRNALHDWDFTTDYWAFTYVREVDSELILDAGREHWHGTQRFRALASSRS